MIATNRLKNQHLLWRAAFGPMAENAAELDNLPNKKLWELLVETSAKKPEKINVAQQLVDLYYNNMNSPENPRKGELSKEQRKEIQYLSKEGLKNLNLRWVDEMINSEAQLREKMSLFWHGHFACRIQNSFLDRKSVV